tara:strand:- start:231 stop:407 length:177 start_codon:yes stop_codon:yes gene_type:complete
VQPCKTDIVDDVEAGADVSHTPRHGSFLDSCTRGGGSGTLARLCEANALATGRLRARS